MVTRVQVAHVIHCSVDAFWANFLDEEFNARLFVQALRFPGYRLLERTDAGDTIRRKLEIVPKLDMPTAVAKIIGERFTYLELGEFDKSAAVYRFRLVPAPGFGDDQATTEGVVRVEPLADGDTNRMVDTTIAVRMLGLGGLLERFAAKAAKDAYDAHARALNEHFRATP